MTIRMLFNNSLFIASPTIIASKNGQGSHRLYSQWTEEVDIFPENEAVS